MDVYSFTPKKLIIAIMLSSGKLSYDKCNKDAVQKHKDRIFVPCNESGGTPVPAQIIPNQVRCTLAFVS